MWSVWLLVIAAGLSWARGGDEVQTPRRSMEKWNARFSLNLQFRQDDILRLPHPPPLSLGVPMPRITSTPSTAGVLQGQSATPPQYTVRRGDTLAKIAARSGTDVQGMMAANPQLRDANQLSVGQALNLPGAGAASETTVRRGDSMARIAKRHGVSMDALIAANPDVRDPALLQVGQTLNLPGTAPSADASTAEGPASTKMGPAAPQDTFDTGFSLLKFFGLQSTPLPKDTGGQAAQGAVNVRDLAPQTVDLRPKARPTKDIEKPSATTGSPMPDGVPVKAVYEPHSADAKALFAAAADLAGVPRAWAESPALHNILAKESRGRVGVPNYTYGKRSRDEGQWSSVHEELRAGKKRTRSSATGLGQLILPNVDAYYPAGREGIGNPLDEAAGMLAYIKDRYRSPERAWARYGKNGEGY